MPAMHYYTVYGLHLSADRPLTEVIDASPPAPGQDTVRIHLVKEIPSLPMPPGTDEPPFFVHPYLDETGASILQVWRDDVRYYLAYRNGNRFVVSRDGNNVWAAWPPEMDFGFVTAQILGPILGLVLRLRGILVLHASVVTYKERALAILGNTGAGKSTTAAELCRQGCQVLSDDIAALYNVDGVWWVSPGYPRLRLWSETAETLYGQDHNLRRIAPDYMRWDKHYLELDGKTRDFTNCPMPLKAIFALNWSNLENDYLQIESLSGAQALATLDSNSFMDYLLDFGQRRLQLTALTQLLSTVSVYQVLPIPGLEKLPEMCKMILEKNDIEASPT